MTTASVRPPLVSVVLPVRNGAASLANAIASVRAQTLTDWELVVVDDGSTDHSALPATQAVREDGRVRLHRQPPLGLVSALQTALHAARGRFIARLDADDCCHPERLSAQVRLLEEHPEIGVAGCQVEFGGDAAAQTGYALHVEWLNSLVTPEEIARNRFIESPMAHPSVLFRRELLDRYGGYRAGPFPEDYELWLRWLEAGVRFAKVARPLLVWNDSPARLSRTDPRYAPEAFYALKAGYLARALEQTRRGRAVWIWGGGRPTRLRAERLSDHGVRIEGYIDVDPRKWNRRLRGRPVLGPHQMPGPSEAMVLAYVANRGARDQIRAQLRPKAFVEGRDFWVAA